MVWVAGRAPGVEVWAGAPPFEQQQKAALRLLVVLASFLDLVWCLDPGAQVDANLGL